MTGQLAAPLMCHDAQARNARQAAARQALVGAERRLEVATTAAIEHLRRLVAVNGLPSAGELLAEHDAAAAEVDLLRREAGE